MHRRKIAIAAGAVVALLSLLFLAAACGGGDNGDADPTATEPAADGPTATESAPVETSVDVSLTEFVVTPSVESVPAGTVTFNVSSDGAIFHNFLVIATDAAPDGLPLDDTKFVVDEEQVDVVGRGADMLNSGETEEVTVDLEAGDYLLICNVPTHYGAGMAVAFTVE